MLRYRSDVTAMEKLEEWMEESFKPHGELPFSFVYDTKKSEELLADFIEKTTCSPKKGTMQTKLKYQVDDQLLLEVEILRYEDFPVAEWVLYFENTGAENTKFIEDVKAMNLKISYPPFKKAGTVQYGAHDNILTYSGGSDCKIDDFIPLQEVLHHIANKKHMHFGSMNGRPTSGSHGCMPYFNLKTKDCGAVLALGWGGQWEMDLYTRRQPGKDDKCFTFEGGMPDTHIRLRPGERIRTPRALLMPWTGQQEESQNLFRRFMRAYHSPHVNGAAVQFPISVNDWGLNEKAQLEHLDMIKESGLPIDTYWIDAGWYGPEGTRCDLLTCDDWSDNVGYWGHDVSRYPNGLKPVSDRAHELGMKFLLWFEHERAMYGTPITLEHPEFFLGERKEGESLIYNLGNPKAWEWMYEMLSGKIEEYGIDILRIDHNEDTLDAWNSGDEEDQRGMTQIRCVEGLYKLWDRLRERYPHLIIDNCASGGRRLELESVSRSIALFRSDYFCYADSDPIGFQAQTCGLGKWVPVSTGGGRFEDQYSFRSTLNQGMSIDIKLVEQALEEPELLDTYKKYFDELMLVKDLYDKDMYLLTGVTVSPKDWLAYELYSPEDGKGAVLSFRRDLCPFDSATYQLKGLQEEAEYEVINVDTKEKICKRGDEITREGITVKIAETKGSSLILFQKIGKAQI